MNRVALLVCVLLLPAGVSAQQPLLHSPIVDIEIPAGAAVLSIQRVTPASRPKNGPLGARWSLELTGFGDPIALDGRPAAGMASSPGFTDTVDARKRLRSRTDRCGNAVSIAYDGQGRVTSINGPKSVQFTLTRDRAGRVLSIRTPRGEVAYGYANDDLATVTVNGGPSIRYSYGTAIGPSRIDHPRTGPVDISYDAAGRVAAYRFVDGSTTRIEFDARLSQQRVTSSDGTVTTSHLADAVEIIDAAGQRWRTAWDAVRRTRSDVAPDGATTRTTLGEGDRVVAIVDPIGRRTTYEYDAAGRVSAIVHPGDRRQSFEYDTFGSLIAERLNTVLVRGFTYNADGTVASARGLNWPERRYGYTTTGWVSSITMAMGGVTAYEHDARGNVIRETNALKGVTQRTYDAQNRLTSQKDPAGAEWTFRYDDRGRLVEAVEPATGVNRFEFDVLNRVVAVTSTAGRSTFEYDAADRLVKVVRPGNVIDAFAYDARGNVVRSIEQGASTDIEYDVVGRVIRMRVDGGAEQAYQYNPAGDVTARVLAGTMAAIDRDPAGRIAAVATAGGTSRLQHDAIGRLTSIVDPLGRRRQRGYAPDGTLLSAGAANGDEIQFAYDLDGRVTSVRRAGGGTDRFTYDAAGNVSSWVTPLGDEERRAYNGAGRLSTVTLPTAAAIAMTWDAAGRLVARDVGNGSKHTFSYDAAGRLIEASDGKNPVRYTRDAAGRTTQVDFVAANKTIRSTYDDKGRRVTLTDGSGRETGFVYNDAGQTTAIRLADGSRVTLAYDAAGRLRTLTYPNGIAGTFDYEPGGDLSRLAYTTVKGQTVLMQSYTYDAAGNMTERRGDANRVTRYAYDAGDQLIGEAAGTSTTRFEYGAGGNRRSMTRDGVTTSYQFDADDRLMAAETVTPPPANRRGATATRVRTEFAYDARGAAARRTTGGAATALRFDPLDRLIEVRGADGAATTFEYSATGDRLARSDASGTVRFLYDGLDLIEEIDAKGQTHAAYTFAPGIDRPIAMWKGGQTYFFLADRDGSILAITDRQGRVVSSYEYDAFGGFRTRKEGVASAFGFAGRELDRATQLYYLRDRYYDPAIGRFLSTDAAAPDEDEPLSFNPYIYAWNNPLKYTDPFGLAPNPAAPYPSTVMDFVRVKLNDLGKPGFDDEATYRGRKPQTNPDLEQRLKAAADKGRGAPQVRSMVPERLRGLPERGPFPEQTRIGPPRPPKLTQYIPGGAVTPGRGTPVPPSIAGDAVTPGRGTPAPLAASPAMSAEELIDRILRKPGDPPFRPQPPTPPRPSLPVDSAEQTIADVLKQPARPPSPLSPATVKPPITVTPPTGTPAPLPPSGPIAAPPPPATVKPPITVTPPSGTPVAAPPVTVATSPVPPTSSAISQPVAPAPGAGTQPIAQPPVRPQGDTVRTPAPPQQPDAPPNTGVLTVVLTAQQLARCYRDGVSFTDCVMSYWKSLSIAGGIGAVVVVAAESGGKVVLGVIKILSRASVALAAAQVVAESADGYNAYLSAAAAMDQADEANARFIEQLTARVRALARIRQSVTSDMSATDLRVAGAEANVPAIRKRLDALEPLIKELEKGGAACRTLNTLQEELTGLRGQSRQKLVDLGQELYRLRQQAASCRTPEAADALRAQGQRVITVARDIDALATRARDTRARLMQLVPRLEPSADYAAASGISTRLRDVQTDLNRILVGTAGALPLEAANQQYVADHRRGIEALRLEHARAKADLGNRSWPEWITNLFRASHGVLDERLVALESAINAEEARMTAAIAEVADQAATRRGARVGDELLELRERTEALLTRAENGGCRFTDDAGVMDEIRRIQFEAGTVEERAATVVGGAAACARGVPITGVEAGAPPPANADLDADRDSPPASRPSDPTLRPPDRTSTPASGAPAANTGGGFVQAPRVLSAVLDCGDVIELPSGGRPELCGIRVRGWDSNTRTPVEIRIQPPFTTASGLSASPGDTSMGGDAMYAAGVQDRPDEYHFGQTWRAARGAPAGSTTVIVIVRQGANAVRLPLTVNVIPGGAPTGSSLEPPTPNLTGSGGPYCVWQYKLFGDPVGCWHLVAAGCTEPRYANRPAYVMVGNNMTRGQADRRIGDLSRYFDDQNCRAPQTNTDPWSDPRRQPDPIADPPIETQPPLPPPAPEPPARPVSRFSRFGISPRDSTIKVGETIALKAYATANGAPDMVLTLDEREVRWSGDKPPTFTATAADAGRAFRITATGPAGESDTVSVLVERVTTTATGPAVPQPAPGPVVNGPAPAGALALIDKVIKPSRSDGSHVTTLSETTCETRFVESPKNYRIVTWTFGAPPPHLEAGRTYEINVSGRLQQEPRLGSQTYPNVGVVHFDGFVVTGTPAQVIITNGQAIETPGRYSVRLRDNVKKAAIAFSCDGPQTFATYTYGAK